MRSFGFSMPSLSVTEMTTPNTIVKRLKRSNHEIREINGSTNYWCSSSGVIYRSDKTEYYVVPVHKSDSCYNMVFIMRNSETVERTYFVHDIIARTWLDRPRCRSSIVHIDDDTTNNAISNLRWVPDIELSSGDDSGPKHVYKLTTDYEIDEQYFSVRDAAEDVGCSTSNIYRACKTTNSTAAGFMWQYKDDYLVFHRHRRLTRSGGMLVSKVYTSIHEAAIDNNVDPYKIEEACYGEGNLIGGYTWTVYDGLDEGVEDDDEEGEEELYIVKGKLDDAIHKLNEARRENSKIMRGREHIRHECDKLRNKLEMAESTIETKAVQYEHKTTISGLETKIEEQRLYFQTINNNIKAEYKTMGIELETKKASERELRRLVDSIKETSMATVKGIREIAETKIFNLEHIIKEKTTVIDNLEVVVNELRVLVAAHNLEEKEERRIVLSDPGGNAEGLTAPWCGRNIIGWAIVAIATSVIYLGYYS